MRKRSVKDPLRAIASRLRGDQTQASGPGFTSTLSKTELSRVNHVRPFTLTSVERLVASMDAARYVVRRKIPGAIVECGVWRGGSIVAMIDTLLEEGSNDRDVYLYDTFEGMTAPTDADTSAFDASALDEWRRAAAAGETAWQSYFQPELFSREQVETFVYSTGYPRERIHFVAGKVEDTIPGTIPEQIAVLRLDTDWYESTKHELEHLYPRVAPGGVLMIDDYGHWDGCRRAVDEYFAAAAAPVLLSRIDYTGRVAIKH